MQQTDRARTGGIASARDQAERIAKLEAELAELRASLGDAEQLSSMKSTVLKNLSHEIRTPLAAIVGFAAVLQEELSDRHQRFLDFIERSGKRLMDALNSILNLSMLEEGNYKLHREEVNVTQQIEEEIGGLRRMAEEKHLDLKISYSSKDIVANVDRTALDRVVHNVLDNAIRFTENGSVEMDVSSVGAALEIKVSDTGPGVRPEFQPLMFNAFAQEPESAQSYDGVGLGLAITKRLVDLMGGSIEVSSAIGKGSTFTVVIPHVVSSVAGAAPQEEVPVASEAAVSDEVRDERREIKKPVPMAPAETPQGKPRVLAVEDNPDMLILLQHLLKSRCAVSTASSGQSAVDQARETQFDAILMDINLGEDETGVDVMLKIREMPGYKDTPIVAVTAYALPGDRERFLQAGFDGYIGKPFTKQQLFRMMDHVLTTPS